MQSEFHKGAEAVQRERDIAAYRAAIEQTRDTLQPGESGRVCAALLKALETGGPTPGKTVESWIDRLVAEKKLTSGDRYEALDILNGMQRGEGEGASDRAVRLAAENLRKQWGREQVAMLDEILQMHREAPMAFTWEHFDAWVQERVQEGKISAIQANAYTDIADRLMYDATHM